VEFLLCGTYGNAYLKQINGIVAISQTKKMRRKNGEDLEEGKRNRGTTYR
jgi:hypothetical protein